MMMMPTPPWRVRLKFARQAAKLSQTKAAKTIGCPVRTLEGWERLGGKEPPEWVQKIILSLLNAAKN